MFVKGREAAAFWKPTSAVKLALERILNCDCILLVGWKDAGQVQMTSLAFFHLFWRQREDVHFVANGTVIWLELVYCLIAITDDGQHLHLAALLANNTTTLQHLLAHILLSGVIFPFLLLSEVPSRHFRWRPHRQPNSSNSERTACHLLLWHSLFPSHSRSLFYHYCHYLLFNILPSIYPSSWKRRGQHTERLTTFSLVLAERSHLLVVAVRFFFLLTLFCKLKRPFLTSGSVHCYPSYLLQQAGVWWPCNDIYWQLGKRPVN